MSTTARRLPLLVDENMVRSATGSKAKGKLTETFAVAAWHAAESTGKSAVIMVVDDLKGSGGAINID